MQILPLAAIHTLGNTLTNISLGAVAVSFTHTIKVSRETERAIERETQAGRERVCGCVCV